MFPTDYAKPGVIYLSSDSISVKVDPHKSLLEPFDLHEASQPITQRGFGTRRSRPTGGLDSYCSSDRGRIVCAGKQTIGEQLQEQVTAHKNGDIVKAKNGAFDMLSTFDRPVAYSHLGPDGEQIDQAVHDKDVVPALHSTVESVLKDLSNRHKAMCQFGHGRVVEDDETLVEQSFDHLQLLPDSCAVYDVQQKLRSQLGQKRSFAEAKMEYSNLKRENDNLKGKIQRARSALD